MRRFVDQVLRRDRQPVLVDQLPGSTLGRDDGDEVGSELVACGDGRPVRCVFSGVVRGSSRDDCDGTAGVGCRGSAARRGHRADTAEAGAQAGAAGSGDADRAAARRGARDSAAGRSGACYRACRAGCRGLAREAGAADGSAAGDHLALRQPGLRNRRILLPRSAAQGNAGSPL
jgi:hypothetical protein